MANTQTPQWQFRDPRLPTRLCYLIQKQDEASTKKKNGEKATPKVTAKDILLLVIIDALVTPQGEKNGLGCWASNKYLGERVGLHPNKISSRISKLEQMNLLIVFDFNGQRYLETAWSRDLEDVQEIAGAYGVAYRKALARGGLTPPLNCTKNTLNATVKPPLNATVNQYKHVKPNSKSCADAASQPVTAHAEHKDLLVEGCFLNGKSKQKLGVKESTKASQSTPSPFATKCARDLHRQLVLKRQIHSPRPPNLTKWAQSFDKYIGTEQRTTDEIQQVLDWYIAHCFEEFVPEACCADTFIEKLPGIERAKARAERLSQGDAKKRREEELYW